MMHTSSITFMSQFIMKFVNNFSLVTQTDNMADAHVTINTVFILETDTIFLRDNEEEKEKTGPKSTVEKIRISHLQCSLPDGSVLPPGCRLNLPQPEHNFPSQHVL